MTFELIAVLLLVLGAELVNGWTDAPNAIATVVGTRALTGRQALLMGSVFNVLGVMSGTAVASTIGTGFIDAGAVDLTTVAAAMIGLIAWSSVAARWGIPTSESHALVAGLTGAAFASAGPSALVGSGWIKVVIGLLCSSVIGFGVAFVFMIAVLWMARNAHPRKANGVFRWLQVGSSAFMAFSHGSNDGQKFIGAFTLALVLGGAMPTFQVHWWVIVLCAGVMALGTALGGWKIMRTLGTRLTRLKTHQGFAAEMAAATTITAASAFGIPLSTTHTISASIVGVGAVNGARAVSWSLIRQLVIAWIVTFPVCAALAWAFVRIAMLFGG
jgi:PiT family inorganic phosphate transporter